MSSGRLFWSERETGKCWCGCDRVGFPWGEGQCPEPFFHKSSWMQVSKEWQKVQVMPLTLYGLRVYLCCVFQLRRESQVHSTQQFLTLSRKIGTHPCFCVSPQQISLYHRSWALLFLRPSDLLDLLCFWRKGFRAILKEADKPQNLLKLH